MLDAIKAVVNVYECINDLLCIPSIRNDLSHSKHRRFVDQELKESIKMIDICSTSRDNLDSIKCQLQDLESALRRGETEVTKRKVREYILMVKKANNDVKKLPIVRKSESTVVDCSDVAPILLDNREVAVTLLQVHACQNKLLGRRPANGVVPKDYFRKLVACKDPEDHAFDITSLEVNIEGLENNKQYNNRVFYPKQVGLD